MSDNELHNFSIDLPAQRIRDVGVGIVIRRSPDKDRSDSEFLITRRVAGAVYAGFWEFPGGKFHEGETADDCVKRELLEEVGIKVEVFGEFSGVEHTYSHGTVRLHPRLCRMAAGSPPPRDLQVAEHRWVSIADFDKYRFPEANEVILRELRAWATGVSGG